MPSCSCCCLRRSAAARCPPRRVPVKFPAPPARRQWQGLRMKRVHALLFLLLPAMLACSVTSSPTRPSYEEERNPYGAPDLADEYARLKRLGERTDLDPPQAGAQAAGAAPAAATHAGA